MNELDLSALQQLVDTFAAATCLQNEQLRKHHADGGNREARRRSAAFKKIVDCYGDEGRAALKQLFTHEDSNVRVLSAAYLLRYCTNESLALLESEAARHKGLSSFGAAQAIQRWHDGTWRLD